MKAFIGAGMGLLMFGLWSYGMYLLGTLAQERRMGADGIDIKSIRLLRTAAEIMSNLGITTSLEEPEIIRPSTRDKVNRWLAAYKQRSK